MTKEILNEEKLVDIKKTRNKIEIVSLIVFAVVVLLLVGLTFIQNRETMKIFVWINSIICIIGLFFGLVYFTEIVLPLNKYIKLISKALTSSKTKETYKIDEIQSHSETYLGVESNVVLVQKENKRTKLFYPLDTKLSFTKGKEYEFEYYHNYIISYKEVVKDDK